MRTAQIVAGLSAFKERGGGTDSERRAGLWLADELRATGREVVTEPFWCRPNWALAHAWHVALGLAGSLVAVHSPRVGGAMVLVALISTLSDALFGVSLGRRLTPERASQNIVALPPRRTRNRRLSLIITANYDAGRAGVVNRDPLRLPAARLRSVLRGYTVGWLGWLVVALVWLLVVAILRLEGASGTAIGVAQILPTLALVISLASLLDLASAAFSPAAGDNGTGVAVVLALAGALDAAPMREAAVHVVLTGAGDGSGLGLRHYLRSRKRSVQPHTAVFLGVAACAHGTARWWNSDGPFFPVRHFAGLRSICSDVAGQDPGLGLIGHRGRGTTPALWARLAGIPSVSIGALDPSGVSPYSHQAGDTSENTDPGVADEVVEVALMVADGVDTFLATHAPPPKPVKRSAVGALGAFVDRLGRPRLR